MAAASTFQEEVCISDLTTDCRVLTESAPPYRIVHVNAAWCQTTGYTSQALVGSTCGVLQGADTCRRTLQVLHSSLKAFRPITVRLLNYRADGTPFVNDLTVMPIVDRTTNTTSHFLGILRERRLPEAHNAATSQSSKAETTEVAAPTAAQQIPSGASSGGPAAPLVPICEGEPASAAAANLAPMRIPSQLQEALQHDVPYPQLITERTPPYKTIHVNAAWCRQCGYRADDLIGRPYSLLLGPCPAQTLTDLLADAFSSGRAATCHAVYFTKSGLPWQAELTLSPLLDTSGTSSTYFVHLLRPSAETAVTIADATPRVANGTTSSSRSARSSSSQPAPKPIWQSTGGHSVISLGGLSSAVRAGYEGLAGHFGPLPDPTRIPQLLHGQQRLHEDKRTGAGAPGATAASGKKRVHENSAAVAVGTGGDSPPETSDDANRSRAGSAESASGVGTSGDVSKGPSPKEGVSAEEVLKLAAGKPKESSGRRRQDDGTTSVSGLSSLENASPSNDGSEYGGENGELLARPPGPGSTSPDNGADDGSEEGSGSGDSGSGESGSGGSGSGDGQPASSHASSLSTATTKDAHLGPGDNAASAAEKPATGKTSTKTKGGSGSKTKASTKAVAATEPREKGPSPTGSGGSGPSSHSSSGGSLPGLETTLNAMPPASASFAAPAGTPTAIALPTGAGPANGAAGGDAAFGPGYNEMLLAQYALAAEAVAKMASNAGMANSLPPMMPPALAGGFNPAAVLGALPPGLLPNALPSGLAANGMAGASPAPAAAQQQQQHAASMPNGAMPTGYPALNVLAATNPGLNASLLSALSATSPFDPSTGLPTAAAASMASAANGAAGPMSQFPPGQTSAHIPPAKPAVSMAASMPTHPSLSFNGPGFTATAAANVLIGNGPPQPLNGAIGLSAARVQSGSLSKLAAACHAAGASETGSTTSRAASVSGAPPCSGAVRVPPFLTKLYTIMQDAQPDDCAGWCSNGNAFRITDPQRFADRCLPRFFKHNKLGSFQQQLLTYGFSRVPNESCLDISAIWQHPKFQAGRPELLEQITRATAKRADGQKEGGGKASNGNDSDHEPAEAEGGDKEELTSMQAHLQRLEHSVSEMHQELRAARDYEMRVLEQLVQRVDKRLRRNPPEAAAAPAAEAVMVPAAAVEVDETASPAVEQGAAGASSAGEDVGAAALAALGASS